MAPYAAVYWFCAAIFIIELLFDDFQVEAGAFLHRCDLL
jgi:hypothetical protein